MPLSRPRFSGFCLALLLSAATAHAQAPSDNPNVGVARLDARLSAIEEQVRQLNGRIEESNYANQHLTERLDRMQRDIDMRFQEIGKASAPAPSPAVPVPVPGGSPAPKAGVLSAPAPVIAPVKEAEPAAPAEEPAAPVAKGSGNPQDDYNFAFKLLNQSRYDESAQAFDQFIKAYPKHPLIGNAYYWLGETFYARTDYTKAADTFRQGFEANPKGTKAADNLLKLAMSLSASGNTKDACVILGQLDKRYASASATIKQKTESERARIACK